MKPYYLVGLICIFTVAACGHLAVKDTSTSLESRVVELWEIKKKSDWHGAYSFFCKNYRDQVSRDHFVERANLRIFSFQLEAIEHQPETQTAMVTLKFDTNIQGFDIPGVVTKERWVYEENSWYICPGPSVGTTFFKKN